MRYPIPTIRPLLLLFVLSLLLVGSGYAAPRQSAGPLHVPSPDWRDQVVYFVMLDRFDDGDHDNNDQGTDEYDPADGAKFSGGDLRGLQRRIGYIHGLGATTVWITPPVANRWWDPSVHYGGYHGYWGRDFSRVDAHFGDLADYQSLSRSLHGAGMYLVQDIVLNHTGNYFRYVGGWDAHDPGAHFSLVPDAQGGNAPAQPPFDRNDVRKPGDRAAAIYHWTPVITDYNDPGQQFDWQLADLDDINTDNPVVRDALRQTYGDWIREVGVDGFRIDTAFYVHPAFFDDFLHSRGGAHPGIDQVAADTGRRDFLSFGEGFALDAAYQDIQARRIEQYVRDADGKPLLPGMLAFPLYGTLGDVFARGRASAELGWRIEDMLRVHRDPWRMPTFIDNHDVARFLAGAGEPALKQALLAIMTLPGIPVIYYGTEQGFTEQRGAMFAGGFGSGGKDHFDTDAPLYHYLQRAIALRRGNKVFSRGTPHVLAGNNAAPGALAWRTDYEGASMLVVFNTSDQPTLLDNLAIGLLPGQQLQPLFAIDGKAPALRIDAGGKLNLVLPARAGWVWRAGKSNSAIATPSVALMLAPLQQARVSQDFSVHGHASGTRALQLVVDGDLAHARTVAVDAHGDWQATIDTSAMVDATIAHRLVAWAADAGVASDAAGFHVARDWQPLADIDDPGGDDHGPSGHYQYPTDPGWASRPLDIEHISAEGAGGALRIHVRMHALEHAWNPPNGFDHVAFTVFLQLPGRKDGSTVMPLQNASLPRGMRWNLRLRAHGWSNTLFSAQGASANNEGTPVTPTALIDANPAADSITFTLPAVALGNPESMSGAKLYLSTWDMDDAPRPLQPQAGPMNFSGGDGARDPLWMDASAVITLP